MHFSIVVLLLSSVTAAARTTICPEQWTYVEKAQRCYRILPGLLTWDDAQKACGAWNATLPSVFNRQADDALRGFAFGRIGGPGVFLIGLRYKYTPPAWINNMKHNAKGEWLWPDGSTANFTNWQGGYAKTEFGHCAQTTLHEFDKGHWFPISCDAKRTVICEVTPRSLPRAATGDEDAAVGGPAPNDPSPSGPSQGGPAMPPGAL